MSVLCISSSPSSFNLQVKRVLTLIHQSYSTLRWQMILCFRVLRAKHILKKCPEWWWIRIEQIGWIAFNWTISMCARVVWFTFIYLGLVYRLIIIVAPDAFFNYFRQLIYSIWDFASNKIKNYGALIHYTHDAINPFHVTFELNIQHWTKNIKWECFDPAPRVLPLINYYLSTYDSHLHTAHISLNCFTGGKEIRSEIRSLTS